MSEEIQDAFEDVLTEEVLQEVTEDDQENAEESQDEHSEEEKPSRHMSKEQWVKAGKDPDEWVSEDVFKERTLRIKNEQRLKRQLAEEKREFDNRLKNVNILAQAQITRLREELLAKRDDAIDVANKAEVKRLDKQIADLDKEAELAKDVALAANKPIEVQEWEEENPWINDVTDPRTPVAQKAFQEAINEGKSLAYALRAADKAIAKSPDKPTEITKRKPAQMVDAPKAAVSSGKDTSDLSWSQLKSEEVTLYEELYQHAGMSKKDFLKAVADQRRGV